MNLTRIEKENMEYFAHLCPEDILEDEELLRLGVLDDDGEAVSMCAAGVNADKCTVEWLFTDPDKREQGAASVLLKHLDELAEGINLEGIEVKFSEDDDELSELLPQLGYLTAADTQMYSVPISDIIYSSVMDEVLENRGDDINVHNLAEIRNNGQVIEKACEQYGFDDSFLEEISIVYSVIAMDHEKNINGGIFIRETYQKDLCVEYFVNNGSVKNIYAMLGKIHDIIMKMKHTYGDMIFVDREDNSISLVEKLTGNDREDYRIPGLMYAVKLFA